MIKEKQRHGCLTAYLIFSIVATLLGIGSYLFAADLVFSQYPDAPTWSRWTLIFLSVVQLVFVASLFMWKKWGFYGVVGLSIITFFVNLAIGLGIGGSIFGLLGIAILYGVLQIGDENKGWPQLE